MVLGTVVLAMVLVALRRPDQLKSPMLWDEESIILARALGSDPWMVLAPLNGEYIWVSSGLVALASVVSFAYLPELEVGLMMLVFLVTALLLVLPQSAYGSRGIRCAMILYLAVIPVNPETYGVLLYAFWWTSLWPVIVLGWRRDLLWLRFPVLAFAGVSSVAASCCAPVFLLLWLIRGKRRDLWSGLILIPFLALQLSAVASSGRGGHLALARDIGWQISRTVVLFFRGIYPVTDGTDIRGVSVVIAVVVVIAMSLGILSISRRSRRTFAVVLVVAAIGFTVLSAVPAPLISDPSNNGPRYYFLPFALYGLLVLFVLGGTHNRTIRILGILVLAIALLPLRTDFSRQADHVSWRDAVHRCAMSSDRVFEMPIHYDGSRSRLWGVMVPTSTCRR
jgi:hypothetical protein